MLPPTFLSAGKAIFTVANPQGVHYTFRIVRRDPDPNSIYKTPAYFISVLTGPDNEGSYTYMGMFNPQDGAVNLTKASKYNNESLPVKVARWAIGLIYRVAREPLLNGQPEHRLPAGYTISHAGRCGRCGRLLTTPESIALGFGPECASNLGL